jgi:3-methyladenine DNA glycosylase Tag
VENLPELLDCLAKRQQLFVHPVTFATLQAYLRGLAAGLRFAGVEWSWDDYHAAAEERGWDPRSSIGILEDFTQRGLSDAEMVRELIAVETAAYMRALARQQMQTVAEKIGNSPS